MGGTFKLMQSDIKATAITEIETTAATAFQSTVIRFIINCQFHPSSTKIYSSKVYILSPFTIQNSNRICQYRFKIFLYDKIRQFSFTEIYSINPVLHRF